MREILSFLLLYFLTSSSPSSSSSSLPPPSLLLSLLHTALTRTKSKEKVEQMPLISYHSLLHHHDYITFWVLGLFGELGWVIRIITVASTIRTTSSFEPQNAYRGMHVCVCV